MSETNFNMQPDFDGFAPQELPLAGIVASNDVRRGSRQFDFSREEAQEMLERAAVEQRQREISRFAVQQQIEF